MNRRGFLQSCLALAAAPAIVRADSLMRIVTAREPVGGISIPPFGNAWTPTLSFSADAMNGFYMPENALQFIVNGIERARIQVDTDIINSIRRGA